MTTVYEPCKVRKEYYLKLDGAEAKVIVENNKIVEVGVAPTGLTCEWYGEMMFNRLPFINKALEEIKKVLDKDV